MCKRGHQNVMGLLRSTAHCKEGRGSSSDTRVQCNKPTRSFLGLLKKTPVQLAQPSAAAAAAQWRARRSAHSGCPQGVVPAARVRKRPRPKPAGPPRGSRTSACHGPGGRSRRGIRPQKGRTPAGAAAAADDRDACSGARSRPGRAGASATGPARAGGGGSGAECMAVGAGAALLAAPERGPIARSLVGRRARGRHRMRAPTPTTRTLIVETSWLGK